MTFTTPTFHSDHPYHVLNFVFTFVTAFEPKVSSYPDTSPSLTMSLHRHFHVAVCLIKP